MKNLVKILFVALVAYLPTTLEAQTVGALSVETIHGEVTIGALNSWGNIHFLADADTDRFYFNKPIWTKGGELGSYDTDLKLLTGTIPRMAILRSNGNVGIGTSAPKARLEVNGNTIIGKVENTPAGYKLYVEEGILAERVRVASKDGVEWADYVFEPDYNLNSTEEVEKFININKHLPNVPSAKEVGEKGVDMVEMDATLLRQIEELWLHVIELKKENKTLNEDNEVMKREIQTLKSRK